MEKTRTIRELDSRSIDYRRQILDIINSSRRGHIGSAFSVIEIIRVLYDDILRFSVKQPMWKDRDRFILSKGHGCLALYVILADKGFFPTEQLYRFCEPEAILGGHPDYGKIPGIEASTGSLGHGLSIGVGIALNARIEGMDYKTFVLLGDGECDEGSIWEAAMSAHKYQLDKLTALIDYNKMQCYSTTGEVQDLEPFADKWRSFGFRVWETDGHKISAIKQTLTKAIEGSKGPNVIICHTVKGKGVVSLENNPAWHHKSNIPDDVMKALFAELESYR